MAQATNNISLGLDFIFNNQALKQSLKNAEQVIKNTKLIPPDAFEKGMRAATSAVENFTNVIQVKGIRGLKEYIAFTNLSTEAIGELGTAHGAAVRQMYENIPPGAKFWDPVIKAAKLAYEVYDKFGSAVFWSGVSGLMNTMTAAISAQANIVYDSLGAIRKQLSIFSTEHANDQIKELYENTKLLGHTFATVAQDYATFKLSLESSNLTLDSQEIFKSATDVSAGMALTEMQASQFYDSLSEMAQKNTVEFSDFTNRMTGMASIVPQSLSAATSAVQRLVDEGAVAIEAIKPELIGASLEEKAAYRITAEDLIDVGSLKDVQAFLPVFLEELNKDLDSSGVNMMKSTTRIANAFGQILYAIGETQSFETSLWLEGTARAAEFLASKTDLLVAAWDAFFALTVSAAGFSLIELTKSFNNLNKLFVLLNLNVKTVAQQTVTTTTSAVGSIIGSITGMIPKMQMYFMAFQTQLFQTRSAMDLYTLSMKVLSKVNRILIVDIFAKLATNPLTVTIVALTAAIMVAKPVFTELGNIVEGTTGKLFKMSESFDAVGKTYQALNRQFIEGDVLSDDYLNSLIPDLGAKFNRSVEELYAIREKGQKEGLKTLTLEERMLYDLLNLYEDLIERNRDRIEQTKKLDVALVSASQKIKTLKEAVSGYDTSLLEQVASLTITYQEYEDKRLEHSLHVNRQLLQSSRELLTELAKVNTANLTDEQLETHKQTIEQTEKEIFGLRVQIAEQTIQMREQYFKKESDLVREQVERLQGAFELVETRRKQAIALSFREGTLTVEAVEQSEQKRLDLVKARVDEELKIESDKVVKLQQLYLQTTEGSDERKSLEAQILETEKRRLELIKEQVDVEREREEILAREIDKKIVGLTVDKDALNTQKQLLTLRETLVSTQADLKQAVFETKQAELDFAQRVLDLELAALQQESSILQLTLSLDQERTNEILERHGLVELIGKTEIDLLQEQQEKKDEQFALQLRQLELQIQAETDALKHERLMLEFRTNQEQLQLEMAVVEAKITKMKADQAVSSAIIARNAALASGDTKAAAEAELQLLQARQQAGMADQQFDLIREQQRALREQSQLQDQILDQREEQLDISHEQARTELEMNRTAEQRTRQLELAERAIQQQATARNLERRAVLDLLRQGDEQLDNLTQALEVQNEITDLTEQQSALLDQVAALESESVLSAEQQLELDELRNNLRETSLDLLNAEFRLEQQLNADRERSLQRQIDIQEQRKTLLDAELGLQQALSDLRQAELEGDMLEIDRAEKLGDISSQDAELDRLKVQEKMLAEEQKMLELQQDADLKRFELEQQIEMMRLNATKAEAQVAQIRAETARAEAQNALTRARESGDEGAIVDAQNAVDFAERGVEAANAQLEAIDGQIEAMAELQEIQRETIDAQQEADRQRLENRERELEIAQEIAFFESGSSSNTAGNRVSGGGVSAGSTYITGERGIELFKGVDGSTQLLGVAGQQLFTPNVPGTIIPNQRLEQSLTASVMRSDKQVIQTLQRGFKSNQDVFAMLAGVLTNRVSKPISVTNYNQTQPGGFDYNGNRLSRL